MATIEDVYNFLTGTVYPAITGLNDLSTADVSGAVNESLSAYETSGVASQSDIQDIINGTTSGAVASAVSGAIVSGIGAWGDLRWSKIYGIPLDEWDAIIRSSSASD